MLWSNHWSWVLPYSGREARTIFILCIVFFSCILLEYLCQGMAGGMSLFFCRTVGVEAARKGYNLIYLASFYSEKVPSNLGLPTLCVVRNRKTRASWCSRIHPSWSWQGGWIHRFTGSNSTFQCFSAHFPQGAKGVCWVYVGWALLGCQSMTNDLDFVCDPLNTVFLNGLYMFITFLHPMRPLFALALRHFISMALQRWA